VVVIQSDLRLLERDATGTFEGVAADQDRHPPVQVGVPVIGELAIRVLTKSSS